MDEPTYRCDVCGIEESIDGIAYLGSEDEGCSPFTELKCICIYCESHKDR